MLHEDATVKMKGSSILLEIENKFEINEELRTFVQNKRQKGVDTDVEVLMNAKEKAKLVK